MNPETIPTGSNILPLFVAIPLGAAFLMPLLGKLFPRLPDLLANLVCLSLLILSITTIGHPLTVYKMGGWGSASGIPVGIFMVLDGLTVLVLIIVNLIGFTSALFSVEYMGKYTDKTKYYTLFLLMIVGMNGVTLSGDLFNMYVFLEVAAIASYALVAFGTEGEELEAAFKYQVMGTIASTMIVLGIIFIYSYTGTLNMADMGKIIGASGHNRLILLVSCLFIMGFGLKAALIPFHAWLPDAHPSAPAPVSAMLSGVLIKVLGIYALLRILFNIIGMTTLLLNVLAILGVLSIMGGVLLALGQWDFKRLLAYHSISQVGYIILGAGLGTPLGILGGLFHFINHSVFKSLLFLNSGAVVYSTGTRDLKKLGGLSRKMPVTGTTSMIASMSIAGIPPFNGFFSKLIIILACIQKGRVGLAVWAAVGSVLTLASFMKVQKYAFLGEVKEPLENVKEVPFLMRLAQILLAILCLLLSLLLLPQFRGAILEPAAKALTNGLKYSGIVLGG